MRRESFPRTKRILPVGRRPVSGAKASGARPRATALIAFVSVAAVAWGWWQRDELFLTPKSGLGYQLGIVGSTFMAALMLYSLRKRLRIMRRLGPTKYWFIVHMLLGIAGPIAILFHSNFHLGSLNSSVALASVMVVTGSGVVGRFIYPKIHHGLVGERITLRERQRNAEIMRNPLCDALAEYPDFSLEIQQFESYATKRQRSMIGEIWRYVFIWRRAGAVYRTSLEILRGSLEQPGTRSLDSGAQAELRHVAGSLRPFLEDLCRITEFIAYERLFSVWHAFHLPLIFLLFTAAGVHVVAVHMY